MFLGFGFVAFKRALHLADFSGIHAGRSRPAFLLHPNSIQWRLSISCMKGQKSFGSIAKSPVFGRKSFTSKNAGSGLGIIVTEKSLTVLRADDNSRAHACAM
jgi:hypothetical protein